jgi:hypothetical protein
MNAMRREYMKWRARDVRNVIQKQRAAAARPPCPRPADFRKPFAERMVDPSFSEQRQMEALLWPRKSQSTPSKRASGQSQKAAHFIERRTHDRTRRIEEYLEMYHLGVDFITTEAGLEDALDAQFTIHPSALSPGVEPQTYAEIVEQVESGAMSTDYDVGYAARIRAERREDVVKALTGKLAGGQAGTEEVLKTIRRAVREQAARAARQDEMEKAARLEIEREAAREVSAGGVEDTQAVEEAVGEPNAEAEGAEVGAAQSDVETPEQEIASTGDVATDPNLLEADGVRDASAAEVDLETSEAQVAPTIETAPEQDLMEAQDKEVSTAGADGETLEADATAAIEDVATEQDLTEDAQQEEVTVTPETVPNL